MILRRVPIAAPASLAVLAACGAGHALDADAPAPAPAPALVVPPPGLQDGTDRVVLPVTAAPAPARLMPGDELDALEAELKPPARFAAHRAAFRVEERSFVFMQKAGPEPKRWRVVLDGDRVVAVLRSGDILLVGFTPDSAPTRLPMPTERLHLDNLLGPSLSTHQFIIPVKTHGAIYSEVPGSPGLSPPQDRWEGDGSALTLVRSQQSPGRRVEHRFTVTCDPVYGYRIDGVYRVDHQAPFGPKETFAGGTFCPGNYVPWPEAALYDRTLFTPAGGGVRGWANNLLCMDRCDSDKRGFAWRDGGYIAYLDAKRGWSPCRTRKDGAGDVGMSLCNAHDDFHVNIRIPELPAGPDGWRSFRAVHRLMAVPPELTRALWDRVELIQQGVTGIVVKVGSVEDFEAQPVPLTEPARGLVWTANAPPLSSEHARSGKQSLVIRGRQWPNLPQISLRPGVRYRLEGWYRVVPWTADELAAAKAKDAAERARLAKAGKPLPAEKDWSAPPRAYIRGDYYEWSPHVEKMSVEQTTSVATGATGGWEHVLLDFTAPDWGPAINISFVAEHCTAYLDDFALRRLDAGEAQAAR